MIFLPIWLPELFKPLNVMLWTSTTFLVHRQGSIRAQSGPSPCLSTINFFLRFLCTFQESMTTNVLISISEAAIQESPEVHLSQPASCDEAILIVERHDEAVFIYNSRDLHSPSVCRSGVVHVDVLASNATVILEASLVILLKDEFRSSLKLNVLDVSVKDADSSAANLDTLWALLVLNRLLMGQSCWFSAKKYVGRKLCLFSWIPPLLRKLRIIKLCPAMETLWCSIIYGLLWIICPVRRCS